MGGGHSVQGQKNPSKLIGHGRSCDQPSSTGIGASGVGAFSASLAIGHYDGQYLWVESPNRKESLKILTAKTVPRLSSVVSEGLYNSSCKLVPAQLSCGSQAYRPVYKMFFVFFIILYLVNIVRRNPFLELFFKPCFK